MSQDKGGLKAFINIAVNTFNITKTLKTSPLLSRKTNLLAMSFEILGMTLECFSRATEKQKWGMYRNGNFLD